MKTVGPVQQNRRLRPSGLCWTPPVQALAEMSDAEVTAITVSHGRGGSLTRLIGALGTAASDLIDRWVVVDDSPEPTDVERRFPDLPMRLVAPGERVFISRAKNLGLREATGRFVFFVDDDNVGDRSCLRGPLTKLLGNPSIGAVMPSVLYDRRPGTVWVYSTPFRADRWGFELIGRNRPRDPALEGRELPTDALPNASLIRRGVLAEIGGLDESLPVNSSADLCQRIQARGLRTVADSSSFIRHDVEPPGKRGFWAEHSIDPDRLEREVADWFVFHRRLHRGEPVLRAKAIYHAAPFLLANELAFLLRTDAPALRLTSRVVHGLARGLRPLPAASPGLTR